MVPLLSPVERAVLTLPRLELERNDGEERTYETPIGSKRSATTILDLTADKRRLEEWRESIGYEQADRIRMIAAARGTGTHGWIENYFVDRKDPRDPLNYDFLVEPYWESIFPFLQTVIHPVVIEAPVYHPDGFAGTLDCIAYLAEDTTQPSLVDWKTADKPLDQQKLYEYTLQVAAYRKAANYVYAAQGLNITRAVIAVGILHDKPQIEELNEDDLDQLYLHFLARLEQVTFIKSRPTRKPLFPKRKRS